MAELSTELDTTFFRFKKDFLFCFSRLLNKVLAPPDMIQFVLTTRCNLQCRMCDVWSQRFHKEASLVHLKRCIQEALEMGIETIYFTGGEALLRDDIFELIDFAARPNVTVTVNTNGSLITEGLAEKIARSKLRNISFSIDSATAPLHNWLRGEGVFEKAMQAIEYINRYKIKYDRNTPGDVNRLWIGMVVVVMQKNIDELPMLADLAERLGICYVAYQPYVNNANLMAPSSHDEFWIGEGDIPRLRAVFKILEEKKRVLADRLHLDIMPEKTIQYFQRQVRVNTCFAGFSRVFINPMGDISFVCGESFGNLETASLSQAWQSEKAFALREKIKTCPVHCTQFCAERSQSDSLLIVHAALAAEIRNLPESRRQDILRAEHDFLLSMREAVKTQGAPELEKETALSHLDTIVSEIEGVAP